MTLMVAQSERIEETLWISLRMFEERKNLLHTMAREARTEGAKAGYLDRARETQMHIERIRAMLNSPETASEK